MKGKKTHVLLSLCTSQDVIYGYLVSTSSKTIMPYSTTKPCQSALLKALISANQVLLASSIGLLVAPPSLILLIKSINYGTASLDENG